MCFTVRPQRLRRCPEALFISEAPRGALPGLCPSVCPQSTAGCSAKPTGFSGAKNKLLLGNLCFRRNRVSPGSGPLSLLSQSSELADGRCPGILGEPVGWGSPSIPLAPQGVHGAASV